MGAHPITSSEPKTVHNPNNSNSDAPKCPVDHKAFMTAVQNSKITTDTARDPNSTTCPVSGASTKSPNSYKNSDVYNVYGEKINPDNQMPLNPNQLPVPGQIYKLSTERMKSNIPKGGTDTTWTYPSPQVFYGSLVRKDKDAGIRPEDIQMVVSIHNNMNEHTWREVMRWEKMHYSDNCPVTLLKFCGRPHDYTPSARVWHWLGADLPFDRHDWVVDRCGTEVRYVIDYYYKEGSGKIDKNGNRTSDISVHVRPAIDSFSGLWDRIRARVRRTLKIGDRIGGYSVPPSITTHALPPTDPDWDDISSEEEFKFLSTLTPDKVNEISQILNKKCSPIIQFAENVAPAEREKAQYAVNYCLAEVICPKFAENWITFMKNDNSTEEEVGRAYLEMEGGVRRYLSQSQKVLGGKTSEKFSQEL